MPVEIKIPRLGWSMEEANFVGWLKKHGDPVKSGEMLFTLESEKAAQEIEATDEGILRILKGGPSPGDVVKVGQVVGFLVQEDEPAPPLGSPLMDSARPSSAPFPDQQMEPEPTPLAMAPNQAKTHRLPAASPRARRRAAELGVDITRLKGSGQAGRISEEDVLAAAAKAPPSSPGISLMRRTIAQRTSASFRATPHFYLRCEVDATALSAFRNSVLPEIQADAGVRLSLTDLILRAQAKALRDFPAARAVWVDESIITLPDCDIGLIVAVPGGLAAPIIRSPEASSLADLAKQRAALVEAARAGSLTAQALQGGATSLSNLGTARVDDFAAVISPSQSSMLAVGRATDRPFVVEGKLAVRNTLRLCLSVDHRVMDGGPAAEWLGRILNYLESPTTLR